MIIIKKDEECFVLVQKIARDKEIKYEYMKKKKTELRSEKTDPIYYSNVKKGDLLCQLGTN